MSPRWSQRNARTDFRIKIHKIAFLRATDFQYIATEKHQKPKQPISKTEKIKSVVKMYLPPETIFTNFATEKIYQNSENVEPKNKCTRISVAFGRFFKPVFLHFSVVKTEIGSSILSEPAGQISRFWA